jgi:hypothetical protein
MLQNQCSLKRGSLRNRTNCVVAYAVRNSILFSLSSCAFRQLHFLFILLVTKPEFIVVSFVFIQWPLQGTSYNNFPGSVLFVGIRQTLALRALLRAASAEGSENKWQLPVRLLRIYQLPGRVYFLSNHWLKFCYIVLIKNWNNVCFLVKWNWLVTMLDLFVIFFWSSTRKYFGKVYFYS